MTSRRPPRPCNLEHEAQQLIADAREWIHELIGEGADHFEGLPPSTAAPHGQPVPTGAPTITASAADAPGLALPSAAQRRHLPTLEEVRTAIRALGKRGRTTRIPEPVRERVLAYAQTEQRQGKSWHAIARELGLSVSAVRRWAQASSQQRPRRLARVRVVADRPEPRGTVVLVSPQGYRIEGLALEQALRVLADLR